VTSVTDVQAAETTTEGGATIDRAPRRPGVKHLFRVVPLAIVALAVLAIVAALPLDIGGLSKPGAGMWPLVAAAVLGLTAAILVFVDIPADYESWDRRTLQIAASFVTVAVFVGLLPLLGFLVDAVLLLLVWLRGFARESWRLSVTLAVIGALALYLLFANLLAVPLPEGLLLPAGLLKG
jgi:putative tricarboxylic transport membrane protein